MNRRSFFWLTLGGLGAAVSKPAPTFSSGGYRSFGSGRLVMLRGGEAIVPLHAFRPLPDRRRARRVPQIAALRLEFLREAFA